MSKQTPLDQGKREGVINQLLENKLSKTSLQDQLHVIVISWIKGLGIPILFIGILIVLKIIFSSFITSETPFLLLFAPIILSSWMSGFSSGVIATFLGAFAAVFFFLHPYKLVITDTEVETLFLYIVEGLCLSYGMYFLRQTQKRAKSVEERFTLLLQNALDFAIIFLDRYGTIRDWSRGAQRLFGYKPEEIVGKDLSILFTPVDREKGLPEKEYRKVLLTTRSTDDNLLLRKNGTTFWGSGATTALWNKDNNILGLIKIVRDSTENHTLEQQKEDFISIAAHELRTPLASMHIYMQLLDKYYKTEKKSQPQTYVKKINAQLQRLSGLISTLLDVSRIQQEKIELHKENLSLTNVIDETIETIQATQTSHQLIRIGKLTKKIQVDRRRLEEVLVNFITNAIKYSPQANRVIIRVQPLAKNVKVSVTDFGIGIPKETIPKIFGRFYRAKSGGGEKAPGLGLGLYISSQIIKAHKGRIDVTSKLGKGSTFSFTIPYKGTR